MAVVLTVTGGGCAFLAQDSQPDPAAPSAGVTSRPSVSTDGRYVVYGANTDAAAPGVANGIYVLDLVTHARQLVSVATDGTPGDGSSSDAVISGDGRYVAFTSDSTTLVANDTNGVTDVFVRDRSTNTTQRISVTTAGVEVADASYAPTISTDGRYVAFTSDSDDLTTTDSNGMSDIFVRDRTSNTTTLVSVGAAGLQTDFGAWDPSISGNGQWIAFTTDTGLVSGDTNSVDDIYERDIVHNVTRRVSVPRTGGIVGGGDVAAVNSDGNVVAFQSDAVDLVSGTDTNNATDVFVRVMGSLTTLRVSSKADGSTLVGSSTSPAISADGSRIAYRSTGNPTGTDANGVIPDVLVRDRTFNRTTLVSTTLLLGQLASASDNPALSGDGRYAFWTSAGAFTGDTNGVSDVFERFVDVPAPVSISPASIARGSSATVTMTGSDFLAGAVLWLPANVTAGAVTVTGDTSLSVKLTVGSGAATGAADIFVQIPGTGAGLNSGAMGKCAGCLTIK